MSEREISERLRSACSCWLLVAVGLAACGKSDEGGADTMVIARWRADSVQEADSLIRITNARQVVIDSAMVVAQPGCDVRLTGLLQTRSKNRTGKDWSVGWSGIREHLNRLVMSDSGENDHLLMPVEQGGEVRASIVSIERTEDMPQAEALEALRCGKVIARIISTGNHAATEIRKDTNWLVIARTQPPDAPDAAWVFVLLNPGQNERISLNDFKYTPHVTEHASALTGMALNVRNQAASAVTPAWHTTRPSATARATVVPERPRPGTMTGPWFKYSTAAEGCLAKGWKSCFIDPPTGTDGGGWHGLGTSGLALQGGGGSQPWVPCPLYGCCCGGTRCHKN